MENRNAAFIGGITEWEMMGGLNTGGLPTLPISSILREAKGDENPSGVLVFEFLPRFSLNWSVSLVIGCKELLKCRFVMQTLKITILFRPLE